MAEGMIFFVGWSTLDEFSGVLTGYGVGQEPLTSYEEAASQIGKMRGTESEMKAHKRGFVGIFPALPGTTAGDVLRTMQSGSAFIGFH